MPPPTESSSVSVAPDPAEIFDRAVTEGRRRLDQSLLELVATSFIAGFTIVFGIVALGIVHAQVEPRFGQVATVAGALAFGPGVAFLIVGRTELFNENFYDPVAAAVADEESWLLRSILRLWVVTFAFNLAGGALFVLVFSVEGALPTGTADALRAMAEDFVGRETPAEFAKSVAGGALVTLLSFFLSAVDTVRSRIALAYAVGFLLALGPFDHVVVTVLHLLFGIAFGGDVTLGGLAWTTGVVTAGNLVGGLGLVTVTHVAQALGATESDG